MRADTAPLLLVLVAFSISACTSITSLVIGNASSLQVMHGVVDAGKALTAFCWLGPDCFLLATNRNHELLGNLGTGQGPMVEGLKRILACGFDM